MGFDRPLPEQFLRFLGGAVRGDFGRSLRYTDQPALAIVVERFPATVELALATLAWSIPVALVLGLASAVRRASVSESVAMTTALLGQSMPSFWLGLMLILVFSVNLGLLPSSGRGTLSHLVLPALTLGGFFMARLTRLVRLRTPRRPRAGLCPHGAGQGAGRGNGGCSAPFKNTAVAMVKSWAWTSGRCSAAR